MAASMTAKGALTAGILLTLFVLQTSAVDENYALNGSSYQYDAYDDTCTLPSKAVDGSFLQDMKACQCAQTGPLSYLPYKPWWVVKLRRWVQVSSFRVTGSQTPNETRDSGYSFLVGPSWNESLPSVVPWNGLTSDPLKGFSLLSQLTGTLHGFPNATTTFNSTFRGAGRYFAVQSPSQPVMFCELEVHGKESVLSGSNTVWSLVTDNPLYQSYNLSVLTDDREDTCLQLGSARDGQVVLLQSVSALRGQLSVIILSKGSMQGQSSRTCQSRVSLQATIRRTTNQGWFDVYECPLSQTQALGNVTMNRFECDCSDCFSALVVSLEWSSVHEGVSQTVEICETMVFPSTLPPAVSSALSSDISARPDCDGSGKYCCPKQEVFSIKYSWWAKSEVAITTSGPLNTYQMTFTKAFSYTDLRVIVSIESRCLAGCCRLFLTYNGNECTNPAPTDLITRAITSPYSIHWTVVLEGICRGIPAGSVIVMLNTAVCAPENTFTDNNLARTTTTRFMVEEAEPPRNDSTPSCLHAAEFNARQYIISTATGIDSGTVIAMNYTKSAVETGLKITFSGTTRVGQCGGASECCGYWEFLINGASCSNPGPIMAMSAQPSSTMEYHFTTPINGICYGIPSGPVQVSLVLGTCSGYTTTADLYTSSSQSSHILIEEVRENTPFLGLIATPVFNLQSYYLSVSTDADSGLLATVRYVKTRSDTALRVSWISFMRMTLSSGYGRNEWHIMFNGQECANPGVINFSWFVGSTFNMLRTGRNFGICRGIAAGNVDVSLNAVFPSFASDPMGNIMTTGGVRVTIEEVFAT